MATVQAPVARWRNDRLFYTSMGIAIALTGVIGFAQTYYLAPFFDAPPGTPEIDGLLHVHGAVFTLWLVLNVVQPALIASKNRKAHRKLGYIGAVVALLMIVVGNIAGIAAMHRDIPGMDERAFYVLPFFAINVFAVIVALAVYWRNRAETHKRLMLLATVNLLAAAFARWPVVYTTGNPFLYFGLADLFIVAMAVRDLRTRGRLHPVVLWGGLAIIVSQPLRLAISGTPAWLAFASWAAGLVK